MVPFAGYEMPVQYPAGIIDEHKHTREKAGLFDVSHMGQAWLHGDGAAATLETLVPGDIQALAHAQGRYTMITNDTGGIVDDLIVTNWSDKIFIVVNASRKDIDLPLIAAAAAGKAELEIVDDRAHDWRYKARRPQHVMRNYASPRLVATTWPSSSGGGTARSTALSPATSRGRATPARTAMRFHCPVGDAMEAIAETVMRIRTGRAAGRTWVRAIRCALRPGYACMATIIDENRPHRSKPSLNVGRFPSAAAKRLKLPGAARACWREIADGPSRTNASALPPEGKAPARDGTAIHEHLAAMRLASSHRAASAPVSAARLPWAMCPQTWPSLAQGLSLRCGKT